MQRYVMHLAHTNFDGLWHLHHDGMALAAYETKAEGEAAGEEQARELWSSGRPAQLVVHRKDGSIECEYTYGDDPERSPD